MAPIILGTAGHIDHGKSSLIKALTGIDPDRLKEEKLRGITIELGFAYLTLPTGQLLGIVDVPGHERFVRHMVAGATGMDLVALVIAADEGVMPQTREHLEICQLLQVKKGLVVLTKVDLVEEDWLELVEEEIREVIQGTFLEGAPIVRFSAVTGEGKEEFLATLAELAAQVPPKPAAGIFRLPIDRVFTIRGFGTVVTGTAISGSLKVGDAVTIYPPEFKARVRTLQVHGKSVEEVLAGSRSAINLQGVEKEDLERGMVVATPGSLIPTRRLDAYLEVLDSAPRPLKHRHLVRFHTGTSETVAAALLLHTDELVPGETGFVQFLLREPVALKPGDRYVIRNLSPAITWGGGQVLHVQPPRHKRFQEKVRRDLETLMTGEAASQARLYLEEAGLAGRSRVELATLLPWEADTLQTVLSDLEARGEILKFDRENERYVLTGVARDLEERISQYLGSYHQKNPLKPGLSKEELRTQLPRGVEARLFNFLLARLAQQGRIVAERDQVRLASHKVRLAADQEKLLQGLEALYQQGGLRPPTLKEVEVALKVPLPRIQELLPVLVNEGRLIKVKEELYFHAEAMTRLKAELVDYLKQNGEITVIEFKKLTDTSRKFTIPLLEYFDANRVTVRVGEARRLREA
ncbi:MAG: selenocysteine-specific translation elongation factor [Deltaproteobacteria bacterium]|nr:selenocysteine-specific translation elongation factor [Deltaproteobacteria bacterium]